MDMSMLIRATDEDLLTTARKYGVQPDSLKALAFALFDRGLSRAEVRFALRGRRKPDDAGTFAATVRSYHTLWRERQGKGRS